MVYKTLEDLRDFLRNHVCTEISLQKPNPDDAASFELVHPVVFIGWPAGKLSGRPAQQRIPGIAIGLSGEAVDNGDYIKVPIELAFIVYAAGTVTQQGTLEIDSTGYQDLANLMDLTMRHIRNLAVESDTLQLAEQDITCAPDNEAAGDYWLGHMQFNLQALAVPLLAEKLLN